VFAEHEPLLVPTGGVAAAVAGLVIAADDEQARSARPVLASYVGTAWAPRTQPRRIPTQASAFAIGLLAQLSQIAA
jgi:hypothetical protein